MIYLLVLLLALIAPDSAAATACTRGTDCYKDCVGGPATVPAQAPLYKNALCQTKVVPVDGSLLVVEDFEAETLHDNVNFGVTTGIFGPFYDDTGQSGNLGANSYWYRNYSNGVGSGLVAGQQFSGGRQCTQPPTGNCVELKVWHPQNIWGMNAFNPFAQVVRTGEFNGEISSLTNPTNAAGGGSGVFDGRQSWAHRIGAGSGSDMGIEGNANFTASRTFGITYALAYPVNLTSSQIQGFGEAWKHNEWHPAGKPTSCADPSGGDGLSGFQHSSGGGPWFPFYGFIFRQGTIASQCNAVPTSWQSDCNTRLNAAIAATGSSLRGNFQCFPDSFAWFGDTTALSGYSFPTSFPLGTWGCFQAFYQNIGTTNSSIDQWFTGTDGIRRNVVHLTGMDLFTKASSSDAEPGLAFTQAGNAGYNSLVWNAYYNGNYSGSPGSHRTVQTTYRYEDNVHVRAGAPVSCAQIGFGGVVQPTIPGTPSGVTVTMILAPLVAAVLGGVAVRMW